MRFGSFTIWLLGYDEWIGFFEISLWTCFFPKIRVFAELDKCGGCCNRSSCIWQLLGWDGKDAKCQRHWHYKDCVSCSHIGKKSTLSWTTQQRFTIQCKANRRAVPAHGGIPNGSKTSNNNRLCGRSVHYSKMILQRPIWSATAFLLFHAGLLSVYASTVGRGHV